MKKVLVGKEKIYFLSLGIFIFYYMICVISNLRLYIPSSMSLIIRIASYLGFVYLFLTNKQNKIKWAYQFLLILISFVSYFYCKDLRLFEISLILFATKDIDVKKIIKFVLLETTILTFLIVILSILKIIPNYQFVKDDEIRNSLGFVYVAQLPALIMHITFLILLDKDLKKEKIGFSTYLLLFVSNYISYRITYVKSIFFCCIVLLIIHFFFKNNKDKNTLQLRLIRILPFIYALCFVITMFLTINYNSSSANMLRLNDILSNRLYFSNFAYNSYSPKLFGNNIELVGASAIKYGHTTSNYFYLDNLYLQLLLKFGILVLISYYSIIYSVFTNIKKNIKLKNDNNYTILLIWLIIIAFYSLFADTAIYVIFNLSLILAYCLGDEYEKKNRLL